MGINLAHKAYQRSNYLMLPDLHLTLNQLIVGAIFSDWRQNAKYIKRKNIYYKVFQLP